MEDSVAISDDELQILIAQMNNQPVPVLAPMRPGAEARRDHRWRVFNIQGNLYWRGCDYGVKVCDISLSGLGLEAAPRSIQADTRGIIVVDLDEYGTLAMAVEIIHAHDSHYAQRIGVHFILSHPDELRPLAAYIEDLSEQAAHTAEP